jgi:hypothetical protein
MSNGSEPVDKFTNFIDFTNTPPPSVLTILNSAWAAYYKAHKQYPSVWITVGNVVYYGGY